MNYLLLYSVENYRLTRYIILSTNTNLINDDQSDDSHIIAVHSLDTLYTLSDTPILLNEPIPDNNDDVTIEIDGEQASVACTKSTSQTEKN